MSTYRRRFALMAVGLGITFANSANAQIGQFITPDGPFLMNGLPGVALQGTTQLNVDTDADGFPDHLYDLPVEIRPGVGQVEYRLSPTQEVLFTRISGVGGGAPPGCAAGQNRIFFHRLELPPSVNMVAFTGEQGACIQGPIPAQGPYFWDKDLADPVRTGMVVGMEFPTGTPTNQAIVWADLRHGVVNADSSTYADGVDPIRFALTGTAAFVTTGDGFQRRYHLIDFCKNPVGGIDAIASGTLPISGLATAETFNNGGQWFALIRINGGTPPFATIPLEDCFSDHACCGTFEPQCQVMTPVDCSDAGGSTRSEFDCGGVSCSEPTGACCENGFCLTLSAGACNGNYQGDGTTCPNPACNLPPPQNQGCCIAATGECVELTVEQCNNSGGTPQGVGTDCSSPTCPPPAGTQACCLPDGACFNFPVGFCVNSGGTPQSATDNCLNGDITCPTTVYRIEKTAPATVLQGDLLTYTINYFNDGPSDATNVVIRDTLPQGATFVSTTEPAGVTFQIVFGVPTWTVGDLLVGGSGTVTITVRVGCFVPGNQLRNATYSITGSPGPTVNGTQVVTTVQALATSPVNIIASSIDMNGPPLVPGDLLEHTVTLTNTIAQERRNLFVRNRFGGDLAAGHASSFDSTVDAAGGTFVVNFPNGFYWNGDLAASGISTIVFRTRVNDCPGAFVHEEALNRGSDIAVKNACDFPLGFATVNDRFELQHPVEVSLTTLNQGAPQGNSIAGASVIAVHEGATIEFVLRITEHINQDHAVVVVDLTIPTGITPDPQADPLLNPPAGATFDAGTNTISYSGPLAAGQTLDIRWNGILDAGASCSTQLEFSGSRDGCADIEGGLRILKVAALPTGPYILGLADNGGTGGLWVFEPGVDFFFRNLLCIQGEIFWGMDRSPDGDIWITDAVQLIHFNPQTDPPALNIYGQRVVVDELQLTLPYDVVIEPLSSPPSVLIAAYSVNTTSGILRRFIPSNPVGQRSQLVIQRPSGTVMNRIIMDRDGWIAAAGSDGLIRFDPNGPIPVPPGNVERINTVVPTDLGGIVGDRTSVPQSLALDTDGRYVVTVSTSFLENFGNPQQLPLRLTTIHSLLNVDPADGQVGTPGGTPTIIEDRVAGFTECFGGGCPTAPPDLSDVLFPGVTLQSALGLAVTSDGDPLVGSSSVPHQVFQVDRAGGSGLTHGPGFGPGFLTGTDLIFVSPGPPLSGDADGDGDVDLGDLAFIRNCLDGPDVPIDDPNCIPADRDGDGDVDLEDVAIHQRTMTPP